MQGKLFLYHLSQSCFAGAVAAHRWQQAAGAAGSRGSRQAAAAHCCPHVGIVGVFPTPIGAGGSERSWVCGCLGGIQLLTEGPRKAQGQIHLQVNPFDGSGALPGARSPQGFLDLLAGIHSLAFLPG